MHSKGQGTTEYLVILAVVIVIALVVVTLLITFTGDSETVNAQQSRLYWAAQDIAILESVADPEGDAIFKLRSDIHGDFDKLEINGVFFDVDDIGVYKGEELILFLSGLDGCTGENGYYDVTIYYYSQRGFEQIIVGDIQLVVDCDDNVSTDNIVGDYHLAGIHLGQVELISPADTSTDSDGEVTFSYNTNGNNLTECFLIIDGVSEAVDSSSPFDSFVYTFVSEGTYAWDINCTFQDQNIASNNGPWEINYSISIPALFAGGAGILLDPYQIETCEQLQNINNALSAYFILTTDVDCSSIVDFNTIGEYPQNFSGLFDGNDYTIFNLSVYYDGVPGYGGGGLFSNINGSAIIKDLTITDANIVDMTGSAAGILAGDIDGTTIIDNVHVDGNVYGGVSGGLVGSASKTSSPNLTITNSSSAGQVTGSGNTGGLVGSAQYLDINNSYSSASVSSIHVLYVGGLVGLHNSGSIENSYATGNVSAPSTQEVGGLVGESSAVIINSYATGDVIGYDYVGGLVGVQTLAITNVYATGTVTGNTPVGGLIGYNVSTLTNGYWKNNQGSCCGDGTCTACTEATAKSDFYTITQDVYDTNPPNWTFGANGTDNNWSNVCDGGGYPPLMWEGIDLSACET